MPLNPLLLALSSFEASDREWETAGGRERPVFAVSRARLDLTSRAQIKV